jgi:hypothetical protein
LRSLSAIIFHSTTNFARGLIILRARRSWGQRVQLPYARITRSSPVPIRDCKVGEEHTATDPQRKSLHAF